MQLFREWRRVAIHSARHTVATELENEREANSRLRDELESAVRSATAATEREAKSLAREKAMERQLEKQIDDHKKAEALLHHRLGQAEETNDSLRTQVHTQRGVAARAQGPSADARSEQLIANEKVIQELRAEVDDLHRHSDSEATNLKQRLEHSEAHRDKLAVELRKSRGGFRCSEWPTA